MENLNLSQFIYGGLNMWKHGKVYQMVIPTKK
jgi:hypothetical protein